MGGIATCVKNAEAKDALKIIEGVDNEYLVTRHSQFLVPINLINVYGEQERRCSVDELRNNWDKILAEVSRIEARNEHIMILVT